MGYKLENGACVDCSGSRQVLEINQGQFQSYQGCTLATMLTSICYLLSLTSYAAAYAVLDKRASVSGTASVRLDVSTGSPHQLASGILYGIPEDQNQIPDVFFRDIAFKYCRAGGAQLPGRGWIGSRQGYQVRS